VKAIVDSKLTLSGGLVYIFDEAVTKEDAIRTLASLLHVGGYVKDSFCAAVLAREEVFPTGLPTEPVGVAIPHTDTEHVNKSALAVGILKQPVIFTEMGTDDGLVKVEIITMMAISDPNAVMPVLRDLAMVYQDPDFLSKLKAAEDQADILDLCKSRLSDVIELV
jgi:PTS system galactitol-specific IIA component